MMAMDENRDFGGAKQQGGVSKETPQQQVQDMGDLVMRDRNHPSVILWSFCNEVGCCRGNMHVGFWMNVHEFEMSEALVLFPRRT